MNELINLDLATLPQVADELSSREHEQFIFIYFDQNRDEWVIDLSPSIDGLKVVELFNSFQGRMLQIMSDQQRASIF
jgi:hypothetical protein